MKFSNYGFLVPVVILYIFAGNSNAAITSDLSALAKIEKLVVSKEFQKMQESIIMSGSDKDSKAAKAAIEAIRTDAAKLQANGDSQKAVNLIIDAILTAVRTVSTAERLANDALDAAKNLTVRDPKAATETVQKSLKSIADFLITCAVPLEDTFGSALALAGGSNQKAIKNAMTSMQNAGTAILASLKIAEQIATMGIEAGGSAASEGLQAACEAVKTGGSVAFKHHYKGAKHILEGAINAASNVLTNHTNRVSGIIESLKSEVPTNDADALAAIGTLNDRLKSMLSVRAKQSQVDGAKILIQALISTILETADAIAVAKNSLREAEKLPSQDTEAAVAAVQKGIEVAINEVVHGSSIGFLGFGAARQIVGEVTIDGLIPAMLEVVYGRVTAYNDLKLAQEIALMGIQSGAGTQGINAAIQICEAAGNALYVQFAESGIIGLEVFSGSN